LPAGSAEARLVTAKLCQVCGFFHEGPKISAVDHCEHCGTRLDAANSLTTDRLFEMATVATQQIERITSEEEERTRQGYYITTHYRFDPERDGSRLVHALAQDAVRAPLLALTYATAATLWRINHRWRRATTDGFTLDLKRGMWAKRPGDDDDTAIDATPEAGYSGPALLSGVRVLVRDTRNILLVRLADQKDDSLLASLQFALQRGIEAVFQVEEQELASERIGEGTRRQILFWEAAEGGAGVLARLADEPDALARVARAALEICHYDPNAGTERPDEVKDCAKACYRCLLSYANQPDHALLDRLAVRDILVRLARGKTERLDHHHAETISEQTPPAAEADDSFIQEVLGYLRATGRHMPDAVRPQLADTDSRPDLLYELANGLVCIFCDSEPPTPEIAAQRDDLADYGYRVITLRHGEDLEVQLRRWGDVFDMSH
jgi:hypothetical protein